jgi:hypothetical protein
MEIRRATLGAGVGPQMSSGHQPNFTCSSGRCGTQPSDVAEENRQTSLMYGQWGFSPATMVVHMIRSIHGPAGYVPRVGLRRRGGDSDEVTAARARTSLMTSLSPEQFPFWSSEACFAVLLAPFIFMAAISARSPSGTPLANSEAKQASLLQTGRSTESLTFRCCEGGLFAALRCRRCGCFRGGRG